MVEETYPVSTEIYYFSGTGNSLHVARELAKRIPGARLLPIVSVVSRESVGASAGTVGFVFPHYASSLPKIVHSFIEKLDLASADYLFAIVTRGRTETMAFGQIDKVLKRKGKQLHAHFVFTMPSGSEPLVKGYAEKITEERIQRLESEMLARLDAVQRVIAQREISRERDTGDGTAPPRVLAPFVPLIRAAGPLLVPVGKRVETTFDFYTDEKCTGCGVCERVCLAERVQMVEGRPLWRGAVKCHGCFACLNFCPLESIQVRSKWYLRSYTEQNGRYHHPEITAKDIAAQKGISYVYSHRP
jgi:Pyruvate/2-oxoacid:ferredoxin oxidoreductase delta subunit/flavodoxin